MNSTFRWTLLLGAVSAAAAGAAASACSDSNSTGAAASATTVGDAAGDAPTTACDAETPSGNGDSTQRNAEALLAEGRRTFRFDTFGDERFWGEQIQLHRAIAGQANGGVGPGLAPVDALAVGLKVDSEALPEEVVRGIQSGNVDLKDPATTLALLKLDAVVGVKGTFDGQGTLQAVGVTCTLCHAMVDDSFAKGIGRRLDGWPNRDLDVGKIVLLAPNLEPIQRELGVDEATARKVLSAWGPGRYDAQLNLDGKGFRPDGKTAATVIPAAFGLAGVNLHTYTGFGSVSYWNAFVANTQMRGLGTFFDPRLNDRERFPLAVKNRLFDVRNTPDLISPKLPALHVYQLAIPAPSPPAGSFDATIAARGQNVFAGKAKCASCHVPPAFTEPGWSMHRPEEIGIDDFQASRSPNGLWYRTTPLKGLFTRAKGGFYHDGRFADLRAVVAHYDRVLGLRLTEQEATDLVEYLRSL